MSGLPSYARSGHWIHPGTRAQLRRAPVLCAVVRLMSKGVSPVVSSEAAGRFEFTRLGAGAYFLEARKPG